MRVCYYLLLMIEYVRAVLLISPSAFSSNGVIQWIASVGDQMMLREIFFIFDICIVVMLGVATRLGRNFAYSSQKSCAPHFLARLRDVQAHDEGLMLGESEYSGLVEIRVPNGATGGGYAEL